MTWTCPLGGRRRSAALNPITLGWIHGSASARPHGLARPPRKFFLEPFTILRALALQPASFCPHGPAPSGAVGTTPSRASLCVGRSVPQPRARKGRRGASPLSQNRRLL